MVLELYSCFLHLPPVNLSRWHSIICLFQTLMCSICPSVSMKLLYYAHLVTIWCNTVAYCTASHFIEGGINYIVQSITKDKCNKVTNDYRSIFNMLLQKIRVATIYILISVNKFHKQTQTINEVIFHIIALCHRTLLLSKNKIKYGMAYQSKRCA